MTPGQWVVVIIAHVIVGLILCQFAVEQIDAYRASKRAQLLRDIADLERELGLNDDPAYRSVWRQQPLTGEVVDG